MKTLKRFLTRKHLELFFAVKKYLKWHDEFNTEGDYQAVKQMNNALETIRNLVYETESALEGL